MMRSRASFSVVCRRRSGELVVREHSVSTPAGFRTYPFIRGVTTVVDSLRLGSRALRWSAQLYEDDVTAGERDPGQGPPAGPVAVLALSALALLTGGEGTGLDAKASESGSRVWGFSRFFLRSRFLWRCRRRVRKRSTRYSGSDLPCHRPDTKRLRGSPN